MKSWKGILLALLILASFAGCSRSATSTPEDSAAESQSAQAETSTEAESTETEQPEAEPLPTFTFGGVEFYPILLSEETLTSLDTTEGTLPGERSETVPRSLPPTATVSCSLSPTPRRVRRCWITTTPTCRRWWRHCTPSASWNPRPA